MSTTGRDPRVTFAIVSTGVLLAALDQFIVNVGLESIGHSLDAGVSGLSWVLNAYSIVFAALLVPAGRLADRYGLREGFLAGAALFIAGSAACAAAASLGQLIAARVLQAVGAATVVPSSLGLLLAAYPPERRAAAVRGWSAVLGAAAALGPPVGGLLVAASWRWMFLINLPVGLLALIAGGRLLPRIRSDRGPFPDLLGACVLASAIGGLSLALVRGEAWGWASAPVLGSAVAAIALGAVFLARSARHPSPVLELPLMRVSTFARAVAGTTLYSAAFASMLLSITLWAETAWGWSALHVGLCFAPAPTMVAIVSTQSGRLIDRIGSGATVALGCGIFGIGVLSWAAVIGEDSAYLKEMLPGALLTGVGVGLALPTLIGTGSSALPPERFATGSGVLNMARQVGFVLGVAVLVAVLGSAPSLSTYRFEWLATVGFAVLGGLISFRLTSADAPGAAAEEPARHRGIAEISEEAGRA